jgi:hypothetical protein
VSTFDELENYFQVKTMSKTIVYSDDNNEDSNIEEMKIQKKDKRESRDVLGRITNTQLNINKASGEVGAKKQTKEITKSEKFAKAKEIETNGVKVWDRVHLGGQKLARNGEKLKELSISAIVNVTKELQCYFDDEDQITYLFVIFHFFNFHNQ